MAKYIGRLVKLGIARESTRGAGSAPIYHIPRVSLTFDDKVIQARVVGSLGKLADSEEAFVTTRYAQGDLEGEIRSKSFGMFLYAMLGTYTAPGAPLDGAYIHPFTISQSNQHQSLSFVVTDDNTTESYKLVMLDSLEITAELDEVVKYSASFMSKKGNASSDTIPNVVDEFKFTKKHLRFKTATTIGGLDSASAVSIKSLTLTIAKNVELDDVLGTAEPEDILNRQLSVEGSISLNYNDETYKDFMTGGTNRAVEIAFINTDSSISGGTTNPSLKIQLPRVDFFDWEPDNSLDEIVTQTFSFKASHDIANNQDIIHLCQLINGVTDYDATPPAGLSPSPSASSSVSASVSPSASGSSSGSSSLSPSLSLSPSGSNSPSVSPSSA